MSNIFMFYLSKRVKIAGITLLLTACNLMAVHADVVSQNEALQGITVTGVVTDNTGETMPGVNIKIKNTTIGTITDSDGVYSIDCPDGNAVLIFSYIGFVSQ